MLATIFSKPGWLSYMFAFRAVFSQLACVSPLFGPLLSVFFINASTLRRFCRRSSCWCLIGCSSRAAAFYLHISVYNGSGGMVMCLSAAQAGTIRCSFGARHFSGRSPYHAVPVTCWLAFPLRRLAQGVRLCVCVNC